MDDEGSLPFSDSFFEIKIHPQSPCILNMLDITSQANDRMPSFVVGPTQKWEFLIQSKNAYPKL
jgi:hypothetical protein